MVKHRLNNIFWLFFEKFGLIILSAFSFVAFAFYLTPTELGIGTLTIVICEMVGSFFNAVFESPLIRRACKTRNELSAVFWFGGAMGTTVIVFMSLFYYWIDSESSLWAMLLFSSISVLVSIQSRPYIAKLRCQRKFKVLALRTLWGKIAGALAGIYAAFSNAGEWSLIIQLTVMNTVAFIILLFSDRTIPFSIPSGSGFVSIIKEGFSIGLRKLLNGLFGRGLVIIMSVIATPEVIGYYSFGRRLVELPKLALTEALASYSLPVFASRVHSQQKITHLFTELTVCICLITIPGFCLLGLFGSEVIVDIFGEKWAGAVTFFLIFSFISGLQMIYILTPSLQAAFGKASIGIYADITKLVILFVIAYALGMKFGLVGVAGVILIEGIANIWIRFYAVNKLIEIDLKLFVSEILKLLSLTAIICIPFFLINKTHDLKLVYLVLLGILNVTLLGLGLLLGFGNWPLRIKHVLTSKH